MTDSMQPTTSDRKVALIERLARAALSPSHINGEAPSPHHDHTTVLHTIRDIAMGTAPQKMCPVCRKRCCEVW